MVLYSKPMKLVILAGGKGKRMGDSSNHTPKPILKYKDKTLIHHKIDELPDTFNEIIIVIGHLGEKIKESVGDNHQLKSGKKVPVTYALQTELLGTAHALHQAKSLIGDSPFIVLMGDDLYSPEDLGLMIDHHKGTNEWCVLLQDQDENMSAGKCIVDESGYLKSIVEDPDGTNPINKMYTGACLLTPKVFDIEMIQLPNSKEFGLPQTFVSISDAQKIKAFEATYWKRITTPEDLM